MIPARRSVDRTQSRRSGGFPRFNAVPPPTGLTARPSAAASARNAAVSWSSPGTTLSEATTPSMETVPTSDSLKGMDAKLLRHRLHAQGADLATHVALGEDLLRVEHPGRIEAVLEPRHRRQIVGGIDQRHVPALLGADPMLSGESAADVDAVGDDLLAGLEHALGRAADPAVEQHQRVQIAVTGMEDIGDRQVEIARDLLDASQRGRQLGARH